MNIFIDESGQFRTYENKVSGVLYECIVAVVIDDQTLSMLEERFSDKDKRFLRTEAVGFILSTLAASNCKIFAVMYDANECQTFSINSHRHYYANSINPENHPDFMKESAQNYVNKLSKKLSPNEYIKALLMIRLLENILRGVVGWSNQFVSFGLDEIRLECDEVTESSIPVVKYFSMYSIYSNAIAKPVDLDNRENIKRFIRPTGKHFDARLFFENLSFVKSKNSMGVRVADVISNQLYRILNREGIIYDLSAWNRLFLNPHSFSLLHFNKDKPFIDKQVNKELSEFLHAIQSVSTYALSE